MKVSVVIPTLNEEHYIEHILDDLKNQSVKPYEVIVVDGGSTDRTCELLKKRKDIRFIRGPRHQGKQRNMGVGQTKGDMLLFVDADTRILPNFIEKSIAEMQLKNLDIGIPKYLPYDSITNKFLITFAKCVNGYVSLTQKVNPYGAACGMFMSKKVFGQTKGFEEVYRIDEVRLVRDAAKVGRYGILHTPVFVSDRRFRRYGILKMTGKYAALGLIILFNQYQLADKIDYSFGEYHKP